MQVLEFSDVNKFESIVPIGHYLWNHYEFYKCFEFPHFKLILVLDNKHDQHTKPLSQERSGGKLQHKSTFYSTIEIP